MIERTMSTSAHVSLQQSPRRIPVYIAMPKRVRHSGPSRVATSTSRASSSTVSSRRVCESSGRRGNPSHGFDFAAAFSMIVRCTSRRTHRRLL